MKTGFVIKDCINKGDELFLTVIGDSKMWTEHLRKADIFATEEEAQTLIRTQFAPIVANQGRAKPVKIRYFQQFEKVEAMMDTISDTRGSTLSWRDSSEGTEPMLNLTATDSVGSRAVLDFNSAMVEDLQKQLKKWLREKYLDATNSGG